MPDKEGLAEQAAGTENKDFTTAFENKDDDIKATAQATGDQDALAKKDEAGQEQKADDVKVDDAAKKADDAEADKKADDKAADKKADEKKDDDGLTAQQKLERRAQDAAAAQLDPEDKVKAKEDDKTGDDDADKKKGKADDDDADAMQGRKVPPLSKDIRDILERPELKDVEIDTGDDKVSIRRFSQQYPEVTQQAIYLAKAIAAQSEERIRAEIAEIRDGVVDTSFWGAVQTKHPDAKTIVKSKPYQEWMEKQSKLVQRMENSPDSEDGIAVLDAYKEHVGKAGKSKESQTKKDKEHDSDVLTDSLKTKKTVAGFREDEQKAKDDFSSAFHAKTDK